MLLTSAKQQAAATGYPDAYRLQPWRYMPSMAIAFPSATDPLDYFSAGGWVGALVRVQSGWAVLGYLMPARLRPVPRYPQASPHPPPVCSHQQQLHLRPAVLP